VRGARPDRGLDGITPLDRRLDLVEGVAAMLQGAGPAA
jgi:hypothetical protein